MGRREENIRVFQDTADLVNGSESLMQAVADSIRRQKLIKETDTVKSVQPIAKQRAGIRLSGKRTLQAAAGYKGKKVCILNFASATNPGGGVLYGSSAQEESICRCSTLYFNLSTRELANSFYMQHRIMGSALYNDDLIYSPDVWVVKSDTANPERLEEKERYKVDVITCAAPNLRQEPVNEMNPGGPSEAAQITEEELEKLLEQRIRRIFAVAAAEQNEVLILGAFGCGAFRNPPELVAKVFHRLTEEYERYFEIIEYAVFHTEREIGNYKAFEKEFFDI